MISHVVLQIIPRLYNEQHYNIVHFFFQKFTKKTFMVRIQLHLGLKLKKKPHNTVIQSYILKSVMA